ncbi:hypothetical protein Adt_34014 [Abeliophyllum distichum]|uniref:Uncharacterized protein n=1 Tax=Abeliophyllum distichum TaxID=126358 RepID=A0ABD1QY19_9LAMI
MADVMSHGGDSAGDPPHMAQFVLRFYRKLVEIRQTQQTQVAYSSASVDERTIAKEVLEEQQGHVCWVERDPNGTSPFLDSTATSNAPRRTSNQFFGDSQNDDPRFAMYKVQLRRMEMAIQRLMTNL